MRTKNTKEWRTLNIARPVYVEIGDHCRERGVPVSRWSEAHLLEAMDRERAAVRRKAKTTRRARP